MLRLFYLFILSAIIISIYMTGRHKNYQINCLGGFSHAISLYICHVNLFAIKKKCFFVFCCYAFSFVLFCLFVCFLFVLFCFVCFLFLFFVFVLFCFMSFLSFTKTWKYKVFKSSELTFGYCVTQLILLIEEILTLQLKRFKKGTSYLALTKYNQ